MGTLSHGTFYRVGFTIALTMGFTKGVLSPSLKGKSVDLSPLTAPRYLLTLQENKEISTFCSFTGRRRVLHLNRDTHAI